MNPPIFWIGLFLLGIHALAQAQPIHGQYFSNTQNNNRFLTAHARSNGEVLLAGIYQSKPFLVCTDTQGQVRWHRVYVPMATSSSFQTIKPTTDGGFIAAGQAYCAKLDSSCTVVWEISASLLSFSDVLQTADGGYCLVGRSTSMTPPLGEQAYLLRLNAQGTLLWDQRLSLGSNSAFHVVEEYPNGDFLLMGEVGNGPTNTRGLVERRNAQGNLIWSKLVGPGIASAALMADGGYLLLGHNTLVKTDANVDSVWAQTLSGATFQTLRPHPNGSFLLAGQNASNFGVLRCLDANGTGVRWAQTFPITVQGTIGLFDVVVQTNGTIMGAGQCTFPRTGRRGYWVQVDTQGRILSTWPLPAVEAAWTLYPNPTTTTFTLALDQAPNAPLQAQLFNLQGQVLQATTISTINTTFTLTDLPTGVYVLQLTDPKTRTQSSYSVVKQ